MWENDNQKHTLADLIMINDKQKHTPADLIMRKRQPEAHTSRPKYQKTTRSTHQLT